MALLLLLRWPRSLVLFPLLFVSVAVSIHGEELGVCVQAAFQQMLLCIARLRSFANVGAVHVYVYIYVCVLVKQDKT